MGPAIGKLNTGTYGAVQSKESLHNPEPATRLRRAGRAAEVAESEFETGQKGERNEWDNYT
ncbi:hypothetical protein GX50_04240 [[Emmonsia] crescens]|uniref:Uncharacterized protein n=1 Tax=[Emmonsia] crescens TaxID=73230 RepID=A0A2B7ZIG8_9EURO|nr:hypothetical protein GX50_04240 [Emmonsia crescens]